MGIIHRSLTNRLKLTHRMKAVIYEYCRGGCHGRVLINKLCVCDLLVNVHSVLNVKCGI